MNIDQAVELGRTAIILTLLIGAPVLLTSVAVGLVISILQAMTQIQDQTITFVPKIAAMLLATLYFLPWLVTQLVDYTSQLFHDIPSLL